MTQRPNPEQDARREKVLDASLRDSSRCSTALQDHADPEGDLVSDVNSAGGSDQLRGLGSEGARLLWPFQRYPALALAGPLVAVVVHGILLWIYWRPRPKILWGDENRYVECALALMAGDSGWRPDFLWPPLYPRFIAGVMSVFGESILAVQLAQTVLLVLAAIVLLDLVRRLTGSELAALCSATMMLTYPPLVAFAHYLWPEVLHLFLFVVLVWLLAVHAASARAAGLAGVVLGLALLTKSILAPFGPVLLGVAYVRRPVAWARAGLFLLGLGVTVGPTIVANWRDTGTPMISDSSAFNLWVGLNDQGLRNFESDFVVKAYRAYRSSGQTPRERNAVLRGKISAWLSERTPWEILVGQLQRQYFKLFDNGTYLSDQLPGGAAPRQGAGYVGTATSLAAVVRGVSSACYALVIVTSCAGFALWRFRDRRWVRLMLAFFAYNLALFLWLHVKSRYRIQLLPVAFLGSGAAVAAVDQLCHGAGLHSDRWRLLSAAGVAAIVLFLAYGGRWL